MIKVNNREDFLKEVRNFLPDNACAVEIGCFRGDFSEKIIDIINPYILYLIDPFKKGGKQYGKDLNNIQSAYSDYRDFAFIKNRFKNYVNIIIEQGFSFEVVGDYNDGLIDLIYHDASHLYQDIKLDLAMWLPKLRQGGVMAGHDYVAFDDFGVIPAVQEFVKEHNFEWIVFNQAEGEGDWALKRRE